MNISIAARRATQEHNSILSPGVSWRGVLLTAAIVFVGAVLGGIAVGPPEMLGDSWEYSWVTYSIAEHGSPVIDVRQKAAFAHKYPNPQHLSENALIRFSDGHYDPPHFWMYSLLASPFYLLCDALGDSVGHPWFFLRGFLLLHAILLGLTAAVAYAFFGKRGVYIFAVFFVASPVIWYLSKPHTELFTFCWFSLTLLFVSKRKLPAAACCLAMAATQNTPFIPFVLLLVGVYLWRNGWPRRLGELGLLAASLVISFLDPSFYWIRHHAINGHVAIGQGRPSAMSLQKALSLFVDPDIGLFPNWPLGLVLIAVAVVFHLHVRKVLTQNLPTAFFSVIFFVLMPFFQSMAVNWNSGATVSMTRYAIWYLPIFLIWIILSTTTPISSRPGSVIRASVAVLGFLAVACIVLNISEYSPSSVEKYITRTTIAEAIYRRWPGLYDPVPEVFVERALETEGELASSGYWAAANAACNKLYAPVIPPEMPGLLKPAGCKEPLDGTQLARWLRQSHFVANPNGYLNLPEQTVKNLPPTYVLGTRLDFSHLSTSNYIGHGWSGQEIYGRWSDGYTSEIVFRLATPPRRDLDAFLQIAGNPYSTSTGACRASVLLNGVRIGNLDAAHQSPPNTYELPVSLSDDGIYRLAFQFSGVRRSRRNDPDPRRLCFYLRSMEIFAMPAVQTRDSLPVYREGETIDFAHAVNAPFLTSGWSVQEQAGRWSDGSPAIVTFYLPSEADMRADYSLAVTGVAISRDGREADVEAFVNGISVGKLDAQHKSGPETYRLMLHNLKTGKCEIKFVIDHGRPVLSAGDPRRLGFYIRTIQLEKVARHALAPLLTSPSHSPGA